MLFHSDWNFASLPPTTVGSVSGRGGLYGTVSPPPWYVGVGVKVP
jgi:hypothetical protein